MIEQEKTKLTFFERVAVKNILRKAKKKIKKIRKIAEYTLKEREETLIAIKELLNIGEMDLLTDEGEEMTTEMLEKLTTKELIDILEMQITEINEIL